MNLTDFERHISPNTEKLIDEVGHHILIIEDKFEKLVKGWPEALKNMAQITSELDIARTDVKRLEAELSQAIGHSNCYCDECKKLTGAMFKPRAAPLLKDVANVLCNVAQLIDGWNHDGVWSEWDQSVRNDVSRIQKILDSTQRSSK